MKPQPLPLPLSPSVTSPLLRRWLARGNRTLDPWLAAVNGLALAFFIVALSGAGNGKAVARPEILPSVISMDRPESVTIELAAPPAPTAAAASSAASAPAEEPPPVPQGPNEAVPDIPLWREAPEMIDPVPVIEPDRPLPPRPPVLPEVKRNPSPRPAAPAARPSPAPRPAVSPARASASVTLSGPGGAGGLGPAAKPGPGSGRGNTPQPPYPAFARRDRLQGTVVVSISVGNGTVSSVRVVTSSGSSALDAYAVRHVEKRWKWPPGTTTTYTQPFRFVLK